MKILITNNRLDLRGGAELFVRDLARSLQSRGHSVLAYSSNPTQGERLMEHDLIPVTTDLENLPFSPDLIHAQHHLDAMSALTALPGVPAIYHCHGAVWREAPPVHPRIYRYAAMSPTLADRLSIESNIAPSNIRVLLNAVDLTRFHTVRKPPARPTRALFYNSFHRIDSPTVAAIREACDTCQLDLDLIGHHVGETIENPEVILPEYDVVFASGKSALDAIACGCAVIVLGRTSCGKMVRLENFEQMRSSNFSIPVNSPSPSPNEIHAELRRFAPDDCAAVSHRLRQEADFTLFVDQLEALYHEAIDAHQTTPPDLNAEILATSRYLRKIVPLIKATDEFFAREADIPFSLAIALQDLNHQLTATQNAIDKIS
jgi:hypothetical protein